MSKSPEIKVCGITRPQDAREASRLGASHLGFILYANSPRFIPAKEAKNIHRSLQAPVPKAVAVDVNPEAQDLRSYKSFSFDFYQLHFPLTTPTERIREWSSIVGYEKLWLAPQIPPGEPFPVDILALAQTFLVDAYAKDKFGGTGHRADWTLFEEIKNKNPHKKWVLAGGIGPINLSDVLSTVNPDVVDMNSALESSPGVKDLAKLEAAFSHLPQ